MLINGEGCSKGEGVKLLIISSSPHSTFKRHSGQMISALDSGLKGLGSRPGWVHVLCSWAKRLTHTESPSTQEYRWVQQIVREA